MNFKYQRGVLRHILFSCSVVLALQCRTTSVVYNGKPSEVPFGARVNNKVAGPIEVSVDLALLDNQIKKIPKVKSSNQDPHSQDHREGSTGVIGLNSGMPNLILLSKLVLSYWEGLKNDLNNVEPNQLNRDAVEKIRKKNLQEFRKQISTNVKLVPATFNAELETIQLDGKFEFTDGKSVADIIPGFFKDDATIASLKARLKGVKNSIKTGNIKKGNKADQNDNSFLIFERCLQLISWALYQTRNGDSDLRKKGTLIGIDFKAIKIV